MDYTSEICMLASRIEADIKKVADYNDLEKTVGYSYAHMRSIF